MNRCINAVIISIFFVCSFSATPSAKEIAIESPFSANELPSLIISYGVLCSRFNEFEEIINTPTNVFHRLDNNIKKISPGIRTGLGFAHSTYIVQSDIPNQQYGYLIPSDESSTIETIPFENILFVTTPIKEMNNKVLVILSEVSPDRTAIFSVDNTLNAELLYDSFDKNIFLERKTAIGSIINIRIEQSGIFLLRERIVPGGKGFFEPYRRTLIINASSGTFELRLLHNVDVGIPRLRGLY